MKKATSVDMAKDRRRKRKVSLMENRPLPGVTGPLISGSACADERPLLLMLLLLLLLLLLGVLEAEVGGVNDVVQIHAVVVVLAGLLAVNARAVEPSPSFVLRLGMLRPLRQRGRSRVRGVKVRKRGRRRVQQLLEPSGVPLPYLLPLAVVPHGRPARSAVPPHLRAGAGVVGSDVGVGAADGRRAGGGEGQSRRGGRRGHDAARSSLHRARASILYRTERWEQGNF
mmetsp:Transcript_46741/g.99180  ORF Transcript_46741/g.99180 Transcript_46741/m.99180 type:complete len:227 (+) Transcript_46741:3020-3700(+)